MLTIGVGLAIAQIALTKEQNRVLATRQIVYSSDARYCAESDPKNGVTKISRIKRGNEKESFWELNKVFPNFHVSSDGTIIAAQMHDLNYVKLGAITTEQINDAVVVEFYFKDSGETVQLKLGQLLKNKKKLKATDEDHYYRWGQVVGFTEEGRYKIETIDHLVYMINPKAKEIQLVDNQNPNEDSALYLAYPLEKKAKKEELQRSPAQE